MCWPKKKWMEVIRGGMKACDVDKEMVMNRKWFRPHLCGIKT